MPHTQESFNKLTETGKFRAVQAAELQVEKWKQFVRHAKGAAKILLIWLFNDDEWDEIQAYRIKRTKV